MPPAVLLALTALWLLSRSRASKPPRHAPIQPFIILASTLQAMSNAMNAELDTSLVNPFLTAPVSFLPIAFVCIVLLMIVPKPLPRVADLAQTPWWAPLSDLAGAVPVFAGLLFTPTIGAGPFSGLLISSDLTFTMMLDNSGWLADAALMIAGVAMISLFQPADRKPTAAMRVGPGGFRS